MFVVVHTSRCRLELQASGEWLVYDLDELANLPVGKSKADTYAYLFTGTSASEFLRGSTDALLITLSGKPAPYTISMKRI